MDRFAGLYREAKPAALKAALRRAGSDQHTAEDLMQVAALSLLEAMQRGLHVDDAGHFTALWCKGIGWAASGRPRWREVLTDDGTLPTSPIGEMAPSPEDDLLGWYGNDAYDALGMVPPRGRALLWCRYYAGMDDHATGAVTGLSARSVNGSRSKATRQLRAAYATVHGSDLSCPSLGEL